MQTNETDCTVIKTFQDPEFGIVEWIQYTDDRGYTVYTYRIQARAIVEKMKKMKIKA